MSEVLIVGGGASGLMAALYAARAGAGVTLLERNEKLGKKIYITGKGRCNLTNASEGEEFMRSIARNPRFCYAALALLDSRKTMALFEEAGLALKTERGKRVFPKSDRASDVTRTLEDELRRLGAKIRLNARVRELLIREGRAAGVALEDGSEILVERVIVATGGLSYPSTGSTGDGYGFARAAGLRVTETAPSLTSVVCAEQWPRRLSGLTLKNVELLYEAGGKKRFLERGELLFTHKGISGPLVLTLTSYLAGEAAGKTVYIDLKPALDEKELDARLLRELGNMSRRQMSSIMDTLEPHALGVELLELAGIEGNLSANSLTKEKRAALLRLLKRLPLTIEALGGFEEAVITRGGVDLRDVNPSTMEARSLKGLYFCGEVLDIDALTGGFNLQLAFSTGALSGKSAGEAAVRGPEARCE